MRSLSQSALRLLAGPALLVVLLRWGFGLEWVWVATASLGLFVLGILAGKIDEYFGQRVVSLASPRVWTLRLDWSDAFLAGVLNKKPKDPSCFFGSLREITLDVLRELRIEEYPTRLRVHRWISAQEAEDGETCRYDWWDVAREELWQGRTWSPSGPAHLHRAETLWSYSAEGAPSVLNLSAVLRWDEQKKREFPELTLWVEAASVDDRDAPIPEEDVLFTIPLDAGLLGEREGRTVYVKGRERKAGEVHPYPKTSESWEGKSSPAGNYDWHLRMQAF